MPASIDFVAQDIRLMLIGLANGSKRFYQFSCGGIEVQNTWTTLLGSGPDGSGNWLPAPWMYAAKVVSEVVGENAAAKTVKLGYASRCYIFDNGKFRTAAIWKWNGVPVELKFSSPVDYRDLMGTLYNGKNVRIGKHPVYVISKLNADALANQIRQSYPDVTGTQIRVSAGVAGAKTCGIRIENLTPKTLSGKVELAGFDRTMEFRNLLAEETRVLDFDLDEPVSHRGKNISVIVKLSSGKTVKKDFTLSAILVPNTKKNIENRWRSLRLARKCRNRFAGL